jgi:predicted transport protein
LSDIKLFTVTAAGATELPPASVQVEKSLQLLFEANLETLLGVRFLASEYSTGPVHGGRIDTLGLDEDGCPVIIEYKRAVNENVINQGLFYLDWLMDHRKDFQWLVLEQLGQAAAANVDWSAPRLLCIAGDFTRYDAHAVKQINRSIELLRYRRFGDDLVMIELVHAAKNSRAASLSSSTGSVQAPTKAKGATDPYQSQRIDYRLTNAPEPLRDLFFSVSTFLASLGDDVQLKELKNYLAFKRIKNFVCLEVYPQAGVVTAYLKINPDEVTLEPGFTRDVRKIGHFGTGDLEVSLRSHSDLERAQPLFQRAYERG